MGGSHFEQLKSLILPAALLALATALLAVAHFVDVPRRNDSAATFNAVVSADRLAFSARRLRIEAWPPPGTKDMPESAAERVRHASRQLGNAAFALRRIARFDQGRRRRVMIDYSQALRTDSNLSVRLAGRAKADIDGVTVWCDDEYSKVRTGEQALANEMVDVFDANAAVLGRGARVTPVTRFIPCGLALAAGVDILNDAIREDRGADALATRAVLLAAATAFTGSVETTVDSERERLLAAAREYAVALQIYVEQEPSPTDAASDSLVSAVQAFVKLAQSHVVP